MGKKWWENWQSFLKNRSTGIFSLFLQQTWSNVVQVVSYPASLQSSNSGCFVNKFCQRLSNKLKLERKDHWFQCHLLTEDLISHSYISSLLPIWINTSCMKRIVQYKKSALRWQYKKNTEHFRLLLQVSISHQLNNFQFSLIRYCIFILKQHFNGSWLMFELS